MRRRPIQRWRAEKAVSDTLGTFGGMVAIFVMIGGLLGVGEVLGAHSTLSQAANAGLLTMESDGCWTQATSDAIAHDVASAVGLSPASVTASLVTPTPWPASPKPPETPITLQLSTVMHPGIGFTIPLRARVTGVVTNPGTSNAVCLTSPTLTTADATAPANLAAIGSASPQIVSVGPAIPGQDATITGDNFGPLQAGTATGAVILTTASGDSWGSADNIQMVLSAWLAPTASNPHGEITIVIPKLAGPGPATVRVIAANGAESIPFPIAIQSP
jgi:hypothetical protein